MCQVLVKAGLQGSTHHSQSDGFEELGRCLVICIVAPLAANDAHSTTNVVVVVLQVRVLMTIT